MRKVVVTQRIDYIESHGEFRDAVDQKLLQWLIHANFLPVPVPNALAVVHSEDTSQLNKQKMLNNWLEFLGIQAENANARLTFDPPSWNSDHKLGCAFCLGNRRNEL